MRSLFIAVALFLGAPVFAVPEEPYAWPLELPRVLTSSFAEYRPGRFHMGIDLRTGAVGKPVFAAADGYVSRLRCSPYGYGKAVYLQLDDGNTAVYAHLDDFAPSLRGYLQRAQHDRESYTVDLYPDPGMFRVRRGDLIALSGQTGIGVPHLHYEIRDPGGAPINPRRLGITWPDSTRPVIRKAVVAPAHPDSTVNGQMRPIVLDVTPNGRDAYRANSVRISGPVAFGVDAVDPANGGATRLGIYRATLAVDHGEPVYQLVHDRVTYDAARAGAVAYHPYLRDQGRFLMLWRWPGNRAEIFAHSDGDGSVTLGGDSATVTIRVEDVNGNTAILDIPVQAAKEPAPLHAAGASDQRGSVKYATYGSWLVGTVEFERDEPLPPALVVRSEDETKRIPMARVTARRFSATYAPPTPVSRAALAIDHLNVPSESEEFVIVRRGAPSTLHRFGSLLIRSKPDSPFGALVMRVTPAHVTASDELRTTGVAFDLWPTDAPIDTPLRVSLPMPADAGLDADRLSIYRKGRRGWDYKETQVVNNRLETDVDAFGLYAVLEDTRPPLVEILRPRDGEQYVSARPSIRVEIDDDGSGIGAYRATYNGEWLLMEYDPERKLLTWEQDEDLPAGAGELVVTVTDNVGNTSTRSVTARLPAVLR